MGKSNCDVNGGYPSKGNSSRDSVRTFALKWTSSYVCLLLTTVTTFVSLLLDCLREIQTIDQYNKTTDVSGIRLNTFQQQLTSGEGVSKEEMAIQLGGQHSIKQATGRDKYMFRQTPYPQRP